MARRVNLPLPKPGPARNRVSALPMVERPWPPLVITQQFHPVRGRLRLVREELFYEEAFLPRNARKQRFRRGA